MVSDYTSRVIDHVLLWFIAAYLFVPSIVNAFYTALGLDRGKHDNKDED